MHWLLDVIGDSYRKVPREAHTQDNLAWSPQGAIDMHRPERWGYVAFSRLPPGKAPADAPRDATWPARERLMAIYYAQRERDEPSFDPADFPYRGVVPTELGDLTISATDNGWMATQRVTLPDGVEVLVRVDHEGRLH